MPTSEAANSDPSSLCICHGGVQSETDSFLGPRKRERFGALNALMSLLRCFFKKEDIQINIWLCLKGAQGKAFQQCRDFFLAKQMTSFLMLWPNPSFPF